MKSAGARSATPSALDGDPRHARFEREAGADRWVQRHGGTLRSVYEGHDDGETLLVLATGGWTRERLDAADVEQGIAAIAAGVAASARSNLEPACSRLLWATRRERLDASALDGAEHYARLAFATARKAPERAAAECVRAAVGFVRAGRAGDLDARHGALERMAALGERRLPNFPALVGSHFPFWSFPFAYRWDDPAPPLGRGRLGAPDPVDDETARGQLLLAYRGGRTRSDLADALERCACAARRVAPGGLAQAGATAAISDLARDLRDTWALRDARSPLDVVDRVMPRTLLLPFANGPGDATRAERRANAVLVPVLRSHWPDLADVEAAHRSFRDARGAPGLAARAA